MNKVKVFFICIFVSAGLFSETVVEEGPKSKTKISKEPGNINVTVEHKETISSEKVIVDKELTDKVMQKFEDADKRRGDEMKDQIDALKAELEYLKKEKERLQKINNSEEDFKKKLDKRIAGLEIRIRRLEKYLGMDESMVDYYQRKRSPWDLVWRSTLFPGWGHRYAREEYTGNAYSTTIIVLCILYYFIDYQANAAEEVAKVALFNEAVIKGYQYSSLGISSSVSNTFALNAYGTYLTTESAINSQRELANNFLNFAIGLYLIQIAHAYFTGVEWAKVQPRDYSNEGLLKPTSFNLKSKPETNFLSKNPERGVRYDFEFTHRF